MNNSLAAPGPSPESPVNLLWTGGWDSTYRLLDLVLRRGRAVAPHYVVDHDRLGTIYELRAMRAIRQRITREHPPAAPLIQPTRITLIDSIAPNPSISQKFARLKQGKHLGSQYEWLARLTDEQKIHDLELSIHADDAAEGFVRPMVEREPQADGDVWWRVSDRFRDDDIGLFASFRFPILNLTKTDMRRLADDAGFLHVLMLTWFCHSPRNGRPCGTCNPCRFTVAEGLAERLPASARFRHRFLGQYRAVERVHGGIRKSLGKVVQTIVRRRPSVVAP